MIAADECCAVPHNWQYAGPHAPFEQVMDDPVLTVYTTPYCGDCHLVKRYLGAHKVRYREVDVTDDPDARAFVLRATNGMLSVPTLAFPDGRVLVEPGLRELEKALSR